MNEQYYAKATRRSLHCLPIPNYVFFSLEQSSNSSLFAFLLHIFLIPYKYLEKSINTASVEPSQELYGNFFRII